MPSEESTEPQDEREAARTHMLRCVAGLPVSSFDSVYAMVYSLTQPVITDEDTNTQSGDDGLVN